MNYKIKYRKKFLTGTLVLFVAVFMLLSTYSVSADVYALEESFEEGVEWPEGWTHYILNSGRTWEISTEQAHTGIYSARVRNTAQDQDEWLISPEIELSGGWDEVTFSFWCYTKIQWETDGGTVRVFVGEPSMFEGLPGNPPDPEDAIWDKLRDEDPDDWEVELWREKVFDISDLAGSTIRIGFNYIDESPQWNFYLDDVFVSSPGYVPKTKLEIGTISGGAGGVSAEIINVGNVSADDIVWSMSMNGGFLDGIAKSAGGEIDEIDPEEMETVGLSGFMGLGPVTVDVTVEAGNTVPAEVSRDVRGFVFLNRFIPIIWG